MKTMGCVVLLCLIWPLTAVGQVTSSSYGVTHGYVFQVPNALPPVAVLNYQTYAAAYEPLPGWDVDADNGWAAIVGTGTFGFSSQAGTDRPHPAFTDAGATAAVSATVSQWGGGLYSASMTSAGSAHAAFIPDLAFAGSSLNTTIVAPVFGWNAGRIIWRPIIHDTVSGSAFAQGQRTRPVVNHDPITVEYGTTIESFFDVFTELSGDLLWDNTGLHAQDLLGELDMTLRIDMDSPSIVSTGNLLLEIENGVVTTSNATGVFAGLGAPVAGTIVGGTLDLPLMDEFQIDYVLPDTGIDEYVFTLGGGGQGMAGVPEPATVALALEWLVLGGLVWRRRRTAG